MLAGLAAAGAAARTRAAAGETVRLGILPFGSVQWIAATISRHHLDQAHGFTLQTVRLASTEAAKVALLGGAVDIATSDWPFVAAQRAQGGHLSFVPNSSLLGGVMVPAGSPIHRLADLRDRRLGVAGGAADKSWLIVRAAARKAGLDLAIDADLSFGAPPLLSAMLQDGRLDALLTFWNFAARLQADGFREAIPVDECARQIGLSESPVLLGWVFDDRWAATHRAAALGFLAASLAACDFLARNPAEWTAIRPLMDAPGEALFENLRGRFIAGLSRPGPAAMQAQATQLLGLLAEDGPSRGSATVPPGVFWQATGSG